MGIKRKKSATYVADTGKEFELEDMSASHLLNVICHHQKQMAALRECDKYTSPPHYLNKRYDYLEETVAALAGELQSRDPDKDHEQDNINKDNWERRYD